MKRILLWLLVFIIEVEIIYVFLGSLALFKKIRLENQEKLRQEIIAPYYEYLAFHRPPELDYRIATHAASIVRMKIPIIMYHYVEYVKDMDDLIRRKLNINPYTFEKQLQTLKKDGYQTIFVKELPDILQGKIKYLSTSAVLTFDDGYEDFYNVVFPLLKKYDSKATLYIINNFIGRHGFIKEKQIQELINSGLVEIGAHTLDHTYLKSQPQSVVRKEIFNSKKDLEKRFGIEVKTIAYPYGAFDKQTIDLVKEASFSAGVSVIPGIYQSKENIFYLSRLRPGIFSGTDMMKILERWKD